VIQNDGLFVHAAPLSPAEESLKPRKPLVII